MYAYKLYIYSIYFESVLKERQPIGQLYTPIKLKNNLYRITLKINHKIIYQFQYKIN